MNNPQPLSEVDPMANKRLSRAVNSNNLELAVSALEAGATANALTGGDPFDPIVKILGRLDYTIMEQAIVRNKPQMVALLGKAGGWVTPKTMTYVADEYVKDCASADKQSTDAVLALSMDPDVLQAAAIKWGPLIAAMTQSGATWVVSVAAAFNRDAYMHGPKELFSKNPFLDAFLSKSD